MKKNRIRDKTFAKYDKGLSTGMGVAEEMGSLGMDVGKTVNKDIEFIDKMGSRDTESVRLGEPVGKSNMKMLTMRKSKSKRGKKRDKKRDKKRGKTKKRKQNSYRSFLSKRLKEVKKNHPTWPQSKVFKEAVKGWKSSKSSK